MRHNTNPHHQRIYSKQLIIITLCTFTLFGCSNISAWLSDNNEEQQSPWAHPVIPNSYTLQPSSDTVSTRTIRTQTTPQQLETRAFNLAFEQLKAAKYAAAIEQFKQFIQQYPQSERRAEARYWIGEAQYLAKDYSQALAQFSHIMIYFADSEFALQALLKSADTYRTMHDMPQAKRFYQRVIKNHPNTSYAVKASERLRQLQ
jgi:tol-pal system protein YbgF